MIIERPFPDISDKLCQILKPTVDNRLIICKTCPTVKQFENELNLLLITNHNSLNILLNLIEFKQAEVPFQNVNS